MANNDRNVQILQLQMEILRVQQQMATVGNRSRTVLIVLNTDIQETTAKLLNEGMPEHQRNALEAILDSQEKARTILQLGLDLGLGAYHAEIARIEENWIMCSTILDLHIRIVTSVV